MTHPPIQAKISQKGLQKIGFFFDQNTTTLLGELLQNARRAKATFVEINTEETGKTTKITILDNGKGISNPATLLHLFESDWDLSTEMNETPAGLGFFSLCHLPNGATVRSKDWELSLDKSAFSGGNSIQPKVKPHMEGTQITFHLDTPQHNIQNAILSAGLHYPVQIRLNKTEIPQETFLQKAEFQYHCPGGIIGVYSHIYQNAYNRNIQNPTPVNFHGVKVQTEIPCIHPGWSLKIEVKNNDILDFVLPARNAVIRNQKLADLTTECRKAIYDFILKTGKPHNLEFAYWQEAQNLGYKIKEAEPQLRIKQPGNYYDNSSWSEATAPNYKSNQDTGIVTKESIISDLNDSEIIALHISQNPIPMIFRQDSRMEGYSWYPKRIAKSVIQKVTHKKKSYYFPPEEFNNEEKEQWGKIFQDKSFPTKIVLELIITDGPNEETLNLETHIAFNTEDSREDGVYNGWIPNNSPKTKGKIDENTMLALFFSASEDHESDSEETQTEEFSQMAETAIINRFEGDKAACYHAVHSQLQKYESRSAFRNLKAKQVTLEIDKDGNAKIISLTPLQKSKKK